jgi:hypothetical protein
MAKDQVDNIRVAFESRAVCYIQCFRKLDDGSKHGPATATGFHWSKGDQLYLITNWHCITGLNANDGKTIGTFTPTHLHVWFNENQPSDIEGQRHVKFVGKEIAHYGDDGVPTWLEHPLGRKVDIVAIPLDGYDWKDKLCCVNGKQQLPDFSPMVGDDCFIVGYPDGLLAPMSDVSAYGSK